MTELEHHQIHRVCGSSVSLCIVLRPTQIHYNYWHWAERFGEDASRYREDTTGCGICGASTPPATC